MHGTPEAAMALAHAYPAEQMQILQTGYEKGDALVLGNARGTDNGKLL